MYTLTGVQVTLLAKYCPFSSVANIRFPILFVTLHLFMTLFFFSEAYKQPKGCMIYFTSDSATLLLASLPTILPNARIDFWPIQALHNDLISYLPICVCRVHYHLCFVCFVCIFFLLVSLTLTRTMLLVVSAVQHLSTQLV